MRQRYETEPEKPITKGSDGHGRRNAMGGRVVVLGGGAGGAGAAARAKRVDPELRITIYQAGEHVSYAA